MAGRYYEELEVGAVLKHSLGRTVTETDNVLFSTLTMNPQPLHLNEDFARKTEFGQRIVNGILTFGIAVGLTVADLTEGTLVGNLSYERIKHPHPVYHGDIDPIASQYFYTDVFQECFGVNHNIRVRL